MLQGLLPMTRLAVGDMAQPTDQVKASGNLEIVLALTVSEVSMVQVWFSSCCNVACRDPHLGFSWC
jgi:hypothetical protein